MIELPVQTSSSKRLKSVASSCLSSVSHRKPSSLIRFRSIRWGPLVSATDLVAVCSVAVFAACSSIAPKLPANSTSEKFNYSVAQDILAQSLGLLLNFSISFSLQSLVAPNVALHNQAARLNLASKLFKLNSKQTIRSVDARRLILLAARD